MDRKTPVRETTSILRSRGTVRARGTTLITRSAKPGPAEEKPVTLVEKQPVQPVKEDPPKESPKEIEVKPEPKSETTRTSRALRGRKRGSNVRGRRNRRPIGRRDRLERVQNANRNIRGGRGGLRRGGAGRFGGFRRRRFGLRSIFIRGLPRFINNFKLANLLRREGRLIRCNVLKNRFGTSRGLAFAEFQHPRAAYRAIKNWNGRSISGYSIYVAYKRRPQFNRGFFRPSRYNRPRTSNFQFSRGRGGDLPMRPRGGFRGENTRARSPKPSARGAVRGSRVTRGRVFRSRGGSN